MTTPIQDALASAMYDLEEGLVTASDVAARLRQAGCRGKRGCKTGCPVWQWVLLKIGGLMTEGGKILVGNEQVIVFGPIADGVLPTRPRLAILDHSPLIMEFLHGFDDLNLWPELVPHG